MNTEPHNDTHAPWTPLPVPDVLSVLRGAPFFWCLAGGRAIEHLVGTRYREHDDTDVVILRSEQGAVREWLDDWHLSAADPPGTLRSWAPGERLPWRVHDVWGRRPGSYGWELQLMIQEDHDGAWYFRRDDRVHGLVDDLAIVVEGVPCLRPDLQLLFKAKSARPKDDIDFERVLPFLSTTQRRTLAGWLNLTSPNGHPWANALAR